MSANDPKSVAPIFDPARLELARKARGWQKAELAEAISVSPPAVSQYELGHAKPSPAVLAQMALALGFPVGFFARGRPRVRAEASGAHFRSLRRTTHRQRDRALAFAEFTWEISAVLERRVKFPVIDLPSIDVRPDADRSEIELVAQRVRDSWSVSPGPIPSMVRLLESRGVLVSRLLAETQNVDAFSCHFPGRPVIVLTSDKRDVARSRFDAAHELGHLVMHHDAEPGNRVIEEQAHAFAAAFLMPRDQIIKSLPRKVDWARLVQLKGIWGVSIAALLYRSRILGILTDTSYRRAVTYMASQGWRTEEPGELGPVERSALIPKALTLVGERGYSLDDLGADSKLPSDVIRCIAELQTDERPSVMGDDHVAPLARVREISRASREA